MKTLYTLLGFVNRLLVASLPLALITTFIENGFVHAQITADGSLKTTISHNGNNFTITNGSVSGNNLFHSFQQFSVPTGGSATFNLANTPNISTIFSRVTGGSVSQIDGSIQIISSSNPVSLFLLNSSGIIFAPNAKLSIGGSFIASTASSIRFGDGVEFSATAGVINPLLTISVPIGLQMGQNPGAITVQGNRSSITQGTLFEPINRSNEPIGLQVGAGNTLALIGGQVNFSGGVLSTHGGGHLEVGSVSNGEVKLNSNAQGWVGDYSGIQQFNDIYLSQQSLIDASGSGGSIQLQGRNISLTDGSTLLIQNLGAQSGGITVNANGFLTLQGNAANGGLGSQIRIDNLGTGQTGDIIISATQLSVQNGGEIYIQLFTPAPGGNINVNVPGSINLNGFTPSGLFSPSVIETVTTNTANAGNVAISTGNLSLLDGTSVGSVTVGSGQAGMVLVNVKDLIEIAGDSPLRLTPSALNSVTLSSGNADNIIVNTSRLVIQDSGFLGSTAVATGSAGDVSINASDSINIQGKASGTSIPSIIASNVEISDPLTRLALGLPAIPIGKSGSLTINTPSLSITDGASATVINDGPGKAGDLQINAKSIFLDQGSINAATASGNGGNIRLNLQDYLLMRDNSLISVTANGSGNGGNLSINAPIITGLENSNIIANAVQGQGGNINIITQGLFGLEYEPQLIPGTSDITASSTFGLSGTVEVNTTGVTPTSGLGKLPENFTDYSQQISTGCSSRNSSSFVATGRGGIPESPNQQVASDRTWADIRDVSAYHQTSKIAQIIPAPEILVQATGWRRNELGKIELISADSPAFGSQSLNCATVSGVK